MNMNFHYLTQSWFSTWMWKSFCSPFGGGVCGGVSYILTSLCTQLKYWSNFISETSARIVPRLQTGWPFYSSHHVQTDSGLI